MTAPTCTAAGYTTYTCSCGDTYTGNKVAALGHTEQTLDAVAPTCTVTGLTEGTKCSVCGITLVAQTTVAATGHSYAESVTAPTCTAEGYTTYTCACGDSYKDNEVAATGHSYTYTNNGDDHTVGCENCDYSATEAHTYTDGKCVCGVEEEKECAHSYAYVDNGNDTHDYVCSICGEIAVDNAAHNYIYDETNKVYRCECGHGYINGGCSECGVATACTLLSWDLSIEAEVIMQFFVSFSDELVNNDGAYARLTLAGQVTTIPMSEIRETYDSSKNRYTVGIGIPSGYMPNVVDFEMVDENGNVIVMYSKKSQPFASYSQSVLDFIEKKLKNNPDAKTTKLMVALATYGGYAQQHFAAGNSNIVSEPAYNLLSKYGLSVPDLSGITKESIDHIANKGTNAEKVGVDLKAADVDLNSAVSLTMKFQQTGTYTIQDYSFVLSYKNIDGSYTPITLNATLDSSSGRYVVVAENIPAAYWDHMYELTVTNKVTGESNTVSYSVLAFIRGRVGSSSASESVKALVRAMYYYNEAANEFFGK